MTALSANTDLIVEKQSGFGLRQDFPAAANAVFFQGAIGVINASGYAEPATTAATLRTAGRCEVAVDNTGGGNGDVTVTLFSGIFGPFGNDDGIAQADVGTLCYLVDDNTVSNDNTSKSVAGTTFEVTSDGVFVSMPYPLLPFGA